MEMGDERAAPADVVHPAGDGDGSEDPENNGDHSVVVCIRQARVDDLMAMQACNHLCLSKKYQMRHYYFHLQLWPQLQFVAEDYAGKIVGCVLAKIEEDDFVDDGDGWNTWYGRIVTVAILRTHRNLGITTKLLTATMKAMHSLLHMEYVFFRVGRNELGLYILLLALGFDEDDEPEEDAGEEGRDMVKWLSGRTSFKKPKKREEASDDDNVERGRSLSPTGSMPSTSGRQKARRGRGRRIER